MGGPRFKAPSQDSKPSGTGPNRLTSAFKKDSVTLSQLRKDLAGSSATFLLEYAEPLSKSYRSFQASFGIDPKGAHEKKPVNPLNYAISAELLQSLNYRISIELQQPTLKLLDLRKAIQYFSYDGHENLPALMAIAEHCDSNIANEVMQPMGSIFSRMKNALIEEKTGNISYTSRPRAEKGEEWEKAGLLVDFILLAKRLSVLSNYAYSPPVRNHAWALLSELENVRVVDASGKNPPFELYSESDSKPAQPHLPRHLS